MKEIPKQITHFVSSGSFEDYSTCLVIPAAAICGLSLGLITANVFTALALPSEIGFLGGLTIGAFGTLLTADYLEIPAPSEILIFA